MKTLRRFKGHHAAESLHVHSPSEGVTAPRSSPAAVLGVVSKRPEVANDAGTNAASGIYCLARGANGMPEGAQRMNAMLEHVTLVVYGWRNVEPGTLSWVFPSVGAAVSAARAMKNAVKWAILAGRREPEGADLDVARAHGAVLVEEAG